MVAQIDYLTRGEEKIPAAFIAHSWRQMRLEGDVDHIICAYPKADPDMVWLDFIEPDLQKARRQLREIVLSLYPDCRIQDS